MSDHTCSVADCAKPRYQKRQYCGGHFMRAYRYGDPLHRPASQPIKPTDRRISGHRTYADLIGQRFGMLMVKARVDGRWLCTCDCGETTVGRVGDLNRGSARSCGTRSHRRTNTAGYTAAHDRVRHDRGSASAHHCIDCGERAKHWSYDHADEAELMEQGKPYSLDPLHYDPRCVSCHKLFDLSRLVA